MSEPEEFMPGGSQRTGGYRYAAPHSREAPWAVKAILRVGKLGRYRLLYVACSGSRSHRLAQVIRTPVGPVVLGLGPITEFRTETHGGEHYDPEHGPFDWEVKIDRRNRINRGEPICCLLADLLPDDSAWMQCRCRTEHIPGRWFADQIEAGRQRVVYGYSTGNVRIATLSREDQPGRRKITFVSGDPEVDDE
jgi:hypothetical protein